MTNTLPPQPQEFTLPFVGREEELKFLFDEYDQMLHAQYRSVWIEAPAGMGKTTLVEEFLKRIDVVPHNGTTSLLKPWIVHAHLRERSSNSLASFVEALGITLQTLTEAQREKLFSGLTSFYKERAKKLVGGANTQSMDMEEAVSTAGYILKQLSKYFPLVIIIEDIHVLKGEISFYVLRHLQAIMEQVPVLTMFVSRPSEEKYLKQFRELSAKEGCKKYEIKSLKYEDVENLVERHCMRLLPGKEDAYNASLRDTKKLMHLSGGNALLLRELLRSGTFDSNDSSVSTTEQIIHYLTKELEQLPKRDRQVIAIAGMLGEEFSERLLREITESKDFRCWSDDVLRRLEQKGIIGRRKKILKPEGEGKEISLRVCVFSHALWWEAARRLYKQEKTWADKKFAEAIVPLLSNEDYPLLTDAELIIKLLRWLPGKMSFTLLEYVDSLCSSEARWNFHTAEERVEILAKARNKIVDLMTRTKSPFTKHHVEMMVRLLDAEKSLSWIKEQTTHIAIENYALMRKLLSQFLDSDRIVFEEVLGIIYDECHMHFFHNADEHTLQRSEKTLKSLRSLAVRHNLEQHRQALLCGVKASREFFRHPLKAAQLFYRGVQMFPRTGQISYNYIGVFLGGLVTLPFSQSKTHEYLLLASHFRKEMVKEAVPTLFPILAYRAEIYLALRAGKITEAQERCKELLAFKEKVWRITPRMQIQIIQARVSSIEGNRDNALRIIQEIFLKFSWRDDTDLLKSLATIFLTIEEWGLFEKLWQENRHHLWPGQMRVVVPLLEARVLMCLLLGNDEGVQEVNGIFSKLRKSYPMLRESIKSSEKQINLFLALRTSSAEQAKKEFQKFIDCDDTVGPFDKAFYSQLFARVGVRNGHDPKEFSSCVKYSLEEFARLSVNKRVVFTAEKFYESKLISGKDLARIRKKYGVAAVRQDDVAKEKPTPGENISVYTQHRHDSKEQGITLRCVGDLQAFYPNGKEIVDRWWGRRKSVPSYHKRIVMELVCASLQHRLVKREELLAIFEPGVDVETLSEKKRDTLNRHFAVRVSQLKKMFSPYSIIIKDVDGFSLDPSVRVDIVEMKNGIGNVTALSTIHPPSALWQIRKWNELSGGNGIAPGIKSKGIEKIRNEFRDIHKKYISLEKQLAMRITL